MQANVGVQGAGSTGRRNTGVKSLCWRFKLQGLAWSFVYTRKIALCVPHFSVLAEVIATTDLLLSAPSRIAHKFAAGHAIRVFDLPFIVRKLEIMLRWQEHSGDIVAQRWLCSSRHAPMHHRQ